ncbi:ABC transporter permease subunit [Aeoliella mucimassa]|uniref:ABC-2 family transporter protein n=1 Tax=Aeoliella mucimassa TaxID=2527972 RepID=A0A518AJ60_9BACT|nr:ABC transporter permease subunit [Aeoliella mucimassa]QDU54740.1 ABC-2 family transporter protein [Aeoliella mucimassa]
MFIGPVFTREASTAPRAARFYAIPAVAVGTLLCLLWTYWQIITGNQSLHTAGSSARFGSDVFQLLAPLEMAVATLTAALLTAAAVAQEKDRKTLVLLLLTRLTNSELVLGRLLASLLSVLMVVAASAPFFFIIVLLGGISYGQVYRVLAVTVMSALAAGSLGSTIALWREKTFQALAMTMLALVLWLLAWEAVGSGALGATWFGVDCERLATAMSPWRAVLAAAESDIYASAPGNPTIAGLSPVNAFLVWSASCIVLLNALAIALVRVWNPSREARREQREDESRAIWSQPQTDEAASEAARAAAHRAPGKLREVWDNPILWREVRTWAYGRKILLIRGVYLIVCALSALALYALLNDQESLAQLGASIPQSAKSLTPLMALSIVLVNALAVTSITSERDTRALDLLLVTDLSAKEIIFGKLGGVIYNSKELLVLPLLLSGYVWWRGMASTESLCFLVVGYLVMQLFSAVLGIHCGMTYRNSRQAAGVSLGTILYLFIGVLVCMRMMVAVEGQFTAQLSTFAGFIAGGGLGLYVALGWRLDSSAIKLACGVAPAATFFIITSFLKQQYGAVFLVTVLAYGFMTAAMLVPAVAEFDVATGRTGERTGE